MLFKWDVGCGSSSDENSLNFFVTVTGMFASVRWIFICSSEMARHSCQLSSNCAWSSCKSQGSPRLKRAQGLVVFSSSWTSPNSDAADYKSHKARSFWCKQNWNWLNELASLIPNISVNGIKLRGRKASTSAICRTSNYRGGSKCPQKRTLPCVAAATQRSSALLTAAVGWREDDGIKAVTHVWPHCVVTGLSKISRHTGHTNSDTSLPPSDTFFLCWAPLNPPSIAISFLHSQSSTDRCCCCCCCATSPLLFFHAQGAERLLTGGRPV